MKQLLKMYLSQLEREMLSLKLKLNLRLRQHHHNKICLYAAVSALLLNKACVRKSAHFEVDSANLNKHRSCSNMVWPLGQNCRGTGCFPEAQPPAKICFVLCVGDIRTNKSSYKH